MIIDTIVWGWLLITSLMKYLVLSYIVRNQVNLNDNFTRKCDLIYYFTKIKIKMAIEYYYGI